MSEPSGVSYFAPLGFQSSSCGYCASNARQQDLRAQENDRNMGDTGHSESSPTRENPYSRASLYARTDVLQAEHYEKLLDRGWRRSGKLIYKPEMRHSCCPHYTVRIPAREFCTKREQRSALHRWNKYVLGEDYVKEAARLHPKSKAEKTRQRTEFDISNTVHAAEFELLPSKPLPLHKFKVTIEPSNCTDEKVALFAHYQEHVHGDPPQDRTEESFKQFLCNSPVVRSVRTVNGTQQLIGSFHQCYYLDGKLIAMGVLDLLPHCVSAVYFIYHQDFAKFSFGKLSAIREACLALEGHYEYYYMGYYIHTCQKMRYKLDYQPQYILDCETFEWNPLDHKALRLMDNHHFLSLSQVRKKDGVEHGLDAIADSPPDLFEVGSEFVRVMERQYSHGATLSDLGFVGIIPPEEVEKAVKLDDVQLRIRDQKRTAPSKYLKNWASLSVRDSNCAKGVIAELIGGLGTAFVDKLVIDFT